jgi:hypothetical protein
MAKVTKQQTSRAIEESLIHWLENQCIYEGLVIINEEGIDAVTEQVDGQVNEEGCTNAWMNGITTGTDDCGLCSLFNTYGTCGHCPIAKIGQQCWGTKKRSAWSEAYSALQFISVCVCKVSTDDDAIANMVDVLASLMPKRHTLTERKGE